jgi:AcrR family transcriptional regulator
VTQLSVTRQALLHHATDVFVENGYELASVREITSRAGAKNLAAINYHFGGKEALYREVLSSALDALSEASLLDDEALDQAPREEAARLFIRRASRLTRLSSTGSLRTSATWRLRASWLWRRTERAAERPAASWLRIRERPCYFAGAVQTTELSL